jgi:hypothetical protein
MVPTEGGREEDDASVMSNCESLFENSHLSIVMQISTHLHVIVNRWIDNLIANMATANCVIAYRPIVAANKERSLALAQEQQAGWLA